MCTRSRLGRFTALLLVGGMLSLATAASADVDVEAAKYLARSNNCFKCHGIHKKKDGPTWASVADKFRGKANAESRLVEHVTSGEMAKFPDGHEEKHKIIKTSPPHDTAQIKNLIDWILSLR